MISIATINSVASTVTTTSHRAVFYTPPQLDVLMLFGFLASVITVLFWMHQGQSRKCVAALAVCLAAMAAYGFLVGAWPLGIIEMIWSVSAFRRWRRAGEHDGNRMRVSRQVKEISQQSWDSESRISRMFGPT